MCHISVFATRSVELLSKRFGTWRRSLHHPEQFLQEVWRSALHYVTWLHRHPCTACEAAPTQVSTLRRMGVLLELSASSSALSPQVTVVR